MSSYSYSESQTFTLTHAKQLASKVARDLKGMQRFYSYPTDVAISNFEAEITELLKHWYLEKMIYGFKRGDNLIVPTLVYTAKELGGMLVADDDPGKIPIGANIEGASFYSFLTYSSKWLSATAEERAKFEQSVPIKRADAEELGKEGYLSSDKTYSSGGRSLERSYLKKLLMDTLKPNFSEIFEQAIEFPDIEMKKRFDMLVGLDDTKEKLSKILGILVNKKWHQKLGKKTPSRCSKCTEYCNTKAPTCNSCGRCRRRKIRTGLHNRRCSSKIRKY